MGTPQIRANAFRGIVTENEEKTLYNRTGGSLSKGDIVAVDLGADGGSEVVELASFALNPDNESEENHPFNNAITPASKHMSGWVFAVVKDVSVADNERFTGILEGVTHVNLDSTVAKDDQIMPTTSAHDATVLTDGNVMVGIALEDGPGSGSANGLAIFKGRCFNGAAGSA